MRICFISVGAFAHIGAYLRYFRQAGHDVHFVSLTPGLEREVPTYNVGFGKKYSPVEGKWKYPLSMLRAKGLIKKLNPDIVHTHYATSSGLTGLVCGFHPTVVTVHGSDLAVGIKSRIWRPLLKAVFRHADCINTVSEELRDMVLSLGVSRHKIETFTLGIDTEKFSFVNRPTINKLHVLRLISTRRLEPVFDHHTIIQALALLKKKGINLRATLVGEGSLLNELKQQVKDAGLVDSVNFMGRVDNSNLPQVLHKQDVYLSASLRDGTSLSLLEAMATGLFPVVSDIKANSAWLKHSVDGLLHKTGDEDNLASCIMKLLSQPELVSKAVRRNRKYVVEKGDRNNNMKRLAFIYEDLIHKARRSAI